MSHRAAPLSETRLFRFDVSTERMNVRNTRWTDRDLLRAPRLVQAAVRRAGSSRNSLYASGRVGSLVRSRGKPFSVFAGIQPGESLRLSARPRSGDLSHPELDAAPGTYRRSRSERVRSISDG